MRFYPYLLLEVVEMIPTARVDPTTPIHHLILHREQPDCPLLRASSALPPFHLSHLVRVSEVIPTAAVKRDYR